MELENFPKVDEVRNLIKNTSDQTYKNAFKYMYLIAGRNTEVCGNLAPLGKHAIPIELEGEEAVLFAVRTARRKKNPFRAVAIPISYEPWAKDILTYFEKHPEEHPFIFVEKEDHKPSSNVRYLQWEAEKIFEKLEWPIPEYSISKKSADENSVGMIWELADRGQLSLEYLPPKTEVIKTEEHIKNFTPQCLRYMRAFELLTKYKFNPIELSIYGGWKGSTLSFAWPSFLDRYFGIKTTEPNLDLLKMMAEIYFRKLCIY